MANPAQLSPFAKPACLGSFTNQLFTASEGRSKTSIRQSRAYIVSRRAKGIRPLEANSASKPEESSSSELLSYPVMLLGFLGLLPGTPVWRSLFALPPAERAVRSAKIVARRLGRASRKALGQGHTSSTGPPLGTMILRNAGLGAILLMYASWDLMGVMARAEVSWGTIAWDAFLGVCGLVLMCLVFLTLSHVFRPVPRNAEPNSAEDEAKRLNESYFVAATLARDVEDLERIWQM
eukprot:TRINITY_DN6009_c0_g1_i1.p1 TRINITY_DN6009_c0_g1~~TRINITY_DN6009_c0_g1_i1.p1  ORF type:complete len:236 (-),score=32.17 TRINITY_DN6009_c0_g1_i1:233-940(-)